MIYFISGHLDLTRDEFLAHYVPRLQAAIYESARFIVGDACGADLMAQEFLYKECAIHDFLAQGITVYHMFDYPRHNHAFKTIGGFRSDKERDEAMTANSDRDIAWIRPGRNKSGTAKNLKRRLKVVCGY